MLVVSLVLVLTALPGFAAEEAKTDAEVLALAQEVVKEARDAAFYPAAYDPEGFEAFYTDYHVIAKKLRSGVVAADYDGVMALKEKFDGLTKIVDDPTSTVWYIWGDNMATEDMTDVEGWEL